MYKMKRNISSMIFLYAIIAIAVNGCAQRLGDFTILSTKNYETSKTYVKVGRHTGSDRAYYFIIPFGIPNMENACDKAIEAGKGVYLTDVVVEYITTPISIGYRITGDVWAIAAQSDLQKKSSILLSYDDLMLKKPYSK
jgi:hypothetical protein